MPSLANVFLHTVDGIFAVDPRQRIVYWNAGCEQMFGIPGAQAVGKRCSEVVRGKSPLQQPVCGGSCCAASFAEGTNIPGAFPLRAYDADGRDLRLSVTLLLVPAICRDQRLCVHLLRRGEAADLALAFHGEKRVGRQDKVRNAALQEVTTSVCSLTTREREILKLLAEGLGVKVIARLMRISMVTVRNHVQHIEAKLSVHSQAEAVAYAYRHNLV
jgi:DNA-binding CsgD family transcriptional regulator